MVEREGWEGWILRICGICDIIDRALTLSREADDQKTNMATSFSEANEPAQVFDK